MVGLVLAMVNAPALNLLGLGEDVARGLGQHVLLARVVGITAITLLTADVDVAAPLQLHLSLAGTGAYHVLEPRRLRIGNRRKCCS